MAEHLQDVGELLDPELTDGCGSVFDVQHVDWLEVLHPELEILCKLKKILDNSKQGILLLTELRFSHAIWDLPRLF